MMSIFCLTVNQFRIRGGIIFRVVGYMLIRSSLLCLQCKLDKYIFVIRLNLA